MKLASLIAFASCAHAALLRGDPATLESSLGCAWSSSLPVTAFALENDTSLEEIGDSLTDQKKDLEEFRRAHADWKVKKQAYIDAKVKVLTPRFFFFSWVYKLWYLNDDLADLKVKKQEYSTANDKMQESIEKLLNTPNADGAELTSAAEGKLGADTLIVFYAPWCPHCQTFVLHDEQGNPLRAPLEVMRKEWAMHEKLNRVKIYRSDVTKLAPGDLPKKMPVEGIPTMYFVTAKGDAIKYQANPHDTAAVAAWAQRLMTK
jgi:thiol-disulfide isomerase/thioredoxin